MASAHPKQRRHTLIDLTGKRFGKLVAIEITGDTSSHTHWLCKCDCGNTTTIRSDSLRKGKAPSCGCALGYHARTHGMKSSRIYGVWRSMHQRCKNPKSHAYESYGGRGITVCERWDSFEAFHEDMGAPPQGYTLDRIDNDGNYEPGNCRWATRIRQNRNTRSTVLVDFRGECVPLMDLAERFAIPHHCLRQRLNRGWDVERAISARPRSHGN